MLMALVVALDETSDKTSNWICPLRTINFCIRFYGNPAMDQPTDHAMAKIILITLFGFFRTLQEFLANQESLLLTVLPTPLNLLVPFDHF